MKKNKRNIIPNNIVHNNMRSASTVGIDQILYWNSINREDKIMRTRKDVSIKETKNVRYTTNVKIKAEFVSNNTKKGIKETLIDYNVRFKKIYLL